MQDIIPPVAQGAPSRAVRRNRSGSRTSSFLVVGIGASAGGLEACRALLDAIPKLPNMAFIIVQHLEPSHPSMLVQLLANHTTMTIAEAADRTLIEPNHVYVIPPGRYLAVANGALKLSAENRLQGARLPFDRLLRSLATNYGTRAAAIIMSGHEHDGSAGLCVIKEHGGLVLVQSLEEAQFGGMPSSAIATGLVDQVLNVSGMPAALAAFAADGAPDHFGANRSGLLEEGTASEGGDETLIKIITLLRAETPHDFRLYKPGTLRRRIEQRIGTTNGEVRSIADYLEKLTHDPKECELLAKDLLINVTGFFRDPKVFEFLAKTTIPDLVRLQPDDQPIRVWIAGCSSGEETYSLAILFREAIAASKRPIKLQVFASDVDPDAIATARDGLYDVSIASEMTQARLARFFRKEDDGYRVLPDLRADVVFAVQDLLIDPPFSRIDFISCRNVLIYLDAQAKTKVIALFHFALRPNGLLLLGSAETIADTAGRFEIVSKPTRLYKHIGRSRPGELSMLINDRSAGRPLIPGVSLLPPRSRHMTLGDLCRQTIADSYGPASILINAKGECLFFLGPTAPYLLVPAGAPTADLYALAIPPIKALLRSTVQLAMREQKRVSGAGRMGQNGKIAGQAVRIDVIPITFEIETLYLVCLIDQPVAAPLPQRLAGPTDQAGVAELERELETTRAELRSALINLEIVGDEQKAINEEALSINEEFQTTNEELQTSKEELQSLNEELSALNGQLQETLERYRSTANDLQNVLYSTEVATLFLDLDLKIRFFTPVTRTLFNVINSDIGRPLADLTSLASDAALADDTMIVLRSHESIEREVSAREGHVFLRRIMPYKTDANV
ncbi:MAG: chemotaxis protein CheB, partial [Alphaproteobacteria bacterium]